MLSSGMYKRASQINRKNILTAQEDFIIRMYMGIQDSQNPQKFNIFFEKEHTCLEITEVLGLPVDKVYEITRNALDKYETPCKSWLTYQLNYDRNSFEEMTRKRKLI